MLKGEGWSFQLRICIITAQRGSRGSLNSRSKLHCNLLICTQSLRKGQLSACAGWHVAASKAGAELRAAPDSPSSTRNASPAPSDRTFRAAPMRGEHLSRGEAEQFSAPGKRAQQQPPSRRSRPPAQPRATCRSGCRYQRCSKPASRPGEKSARKLQIPPSSFSSREGLSRGYSMPPLTAAARPTAAASSSTSSCRRHRPTARHGAAAAILVVGSAGRGGVAAAIGPGEGVGGGAAAPGRGWEGRRWRSNEVVLLES